MWGSRKGNKVIIIDDEPDFIEMVKIRLEANGYKVITASGGHEGLAMIRSEKPRVIILDVMMPGMDGFEVAKEIKSDPDICNIPVIMLTALGVSFDIDHEENLKKAREAGVFSFLTKPFIPADLIDAVELAFKS